MLYRKLLRNVPIKQKSSARMRLDAFGICLLKQTASSAQSIASPLKIEGFREFEADLSALFLNINKERDEKNEKNCGHRSK